MQLLASRESIMTKHKHSSSSHAYYYHWDAMRILIIIGAVVTITLATIWMLPFPYYSNYGEDYFRPGLIPSFVWVIAWGIGDVILSICLLSGTGAVRRRKLRIWINWFTLIVVGLVIVLPTGNWGGVIVVIAGVVGIIDRVH